MAVPNIFATATSSIPLSQLDTNFATAITLGSTALYLGNTTTSVAGLTLTGATLGGTFSGTSVTDSGLTSGRVTYAGTAGLLQDSANLTFNGTTLTVGSGNSALKIDALGANNFEIYNGALTADGTNYAFAQNYTGANTQVNAASGGQVLLQIAGATKATLNSTGLAVTGTLSATGLTSLGAATGFSRLLLGNAAPSGNNEAYIDFISSNSLYNWRISSNLYAASWQLTPSTAAGGSTFTTPLLSVSSAGIVTMSAYGAGAATFSAAGVISSVSDETWKIKDGTPVDPNAMLKKLEPGYWYYNDEKKETFGKDRQLGFYAQNVNAAIGPEAAPEPEEGKPWGYYDRSVLAVTVMSLQKALATIEALTARIAALEAK